MLNRLTISGTLEDAPRIGRSRHEHYGHFQLVQESTWLDREGKRRRRTSSLRAVCFGTLARTLHRLERGDRLILTGWLQSRRKPRIGRTLPPLEIVFHEYEHRREVAVEELDRMPSELDTVSTNSVTLVGEVVRAPIRAEIDEREALHFVIENKVRWRGPRREWRERSTWVRVVAFDPVARGLELLREGNLIAVSGRLRARRVEGVEEPLRTLHELVAGQVDYVSFSRRRAA